MNKSFSWINLLFVKLLYVYDPSNRNHVFVRFINVIISGNLSCWPNRSLNLSLWEVTQEETDRSSKYTTWSQILLKQKPLKQSFNFMKHANEMLIKTCSCHKGRDISSALDIILYITLSYLKKILKSYVLQSC